jgi:hypothetical protein
MGMREVTVTLLPEHEEDLTRLRMHKPSLFKEVNDTGVLAMALDILAHLIHRATVNQCPHARHALEHIGLPPEGGTWPAADHDSTPH